MHKVRTLMLAALCAGAVHAAAQDNVPAAQSGQAGTDQGMGPPPGEITQPPATRSSGSAGANAADCPPALGQGTANRVDPPGPVSRSGSASAMVEDSGTLGSTGSTRASSTSGATGTTGETGSYGADPSGSVTTAGSTGAPAGPSNQCDDGSTTSSGASGGSGMQGTMPDNQQLPVQGQGQEGASPSNQAEQMPAQQGR